MSESVWDEAEVAWNHAAFTLLGGQIREGYDIGAEMLARFEELQAEMEDVREEYARLRAAVNEFDGGCVPSCDKFGHAEDCHLDMATTLQLQQAEIERLRSALSAVSGAK